MSPIAINNNNSNGGGGAMNGNTNGASLSSSSGGHSESLQQRHPTARRSPIAHNGGLAVHLHPDELLTNKHKQGPDGDEAPPQVKVDEARGEMRAVYEDRGAFVERESCFLFFFPAG